jgi:hypothetical protein
MLRRVALVKIDVSEELSASFIRVEKIGELETIQAVTSNRCTLQAAVLTRATRRNIPEDAILHSHRRENLKFLHLRLLWKAQWYPRHWNLLQLPRINSSARQRKRFSSDVRTCPPFCESVNTLIRLKVDVTSPKQICPLCINERQYPIRGFHCSFCRDSCWEHCHWLCDVFCWTRRHPMTTHGTSVEQSNVPIVTWLAATPVSHTRGRM